MLRARKLIFKWMRPDVYAGLQCMSFTANVEPLSQIEEKNKVDAVLSRQEPSAENPGTKTISHNLLGRLSLDKGREQNILRVLYKDFRKEPEGNIFQEMKKLDASESVTLLSNLAAVKERLPSVINILLINIYNNANSLNLKKCGLVLFNMSSLRTYNEVVIEKIALQACESLHQDKNFKETPKVLKSLAILKFRNANVLDRLLSWHKTNLTLCEEKDVISMFVSIAMLNYCPKDLDFLIEVAGNQIEKNVSPVQYLHFVWSLVLLNRATEEQIASVLCDEFISKLVASKESDSLINGSILKLQNIRGHVRHFMPNYKGPEITTELCKMQPKPLSPSVHHLLKAFMNVYPKVELTRNVDTEAGFPIVAECLLPTNSTSKQIANGQKKLAILPLDYFDVCMGKGETGGPVIPTGLAAFYERILKAKNYNLLIVNYLELNNATTKQLEELIRKKVKILSSK